MKFGSWSSFQHHVCLENEFYTGLVNGHNTLACRTNNHEGMIVELYQLCLSPQLEGNYPTFFIFDFKIFKVQACSLIAYQATLVSQLV